MGEIIDFTTKKRARIHTLAERTKMASLHVLDLFEPTWLTFDQARAFTRGYEGTMMVPARDKQGVFLYYLKDAPKVIAADSYATQLYTEFQKLKGRS